ncbi:hypothetical protein TNCV_2527721 [Trichonephila clavipes]|nr:hypothetical protein TNCV_2527721 [Trichonephila clavipes]
MALRRTLIETLNTTGGRPADFASNRNRDPKPNGGRKTREKRQESYKKSPGNVPGGLWIKRRGDKSHVKGAVENEKGGTKRRGRFKGEGWKGEGCQRRWVSKETGFQRRQGSG